MSNARKKILIFVADNYEDLEAQYPKYRFLEAGFDVVVVGEKKDNIYKGKYGYPCKADASFDEINVNDFSALIIPGGYAPDKLRRIPKVLEITRQFHDQHKIIGFICHAGWVPISAKVLKGVTCTSFSAIKDDMENAGANWIDDAVVIDKHFVSSRCPDDLPLFCQAIIKLLTDK